VSNETRNGVILHENQPLLHTETDCSDPPPRSRCPPLAFPPRHGCGRRPQANEVHRFAYAQTGWCVSNETRNGVILLDNNQPLLLTETNGPFRPTTAFQMPSVGVPASPWMWAKAKSERGALIRLCGDGVVKSLNNKFCIYS
jgi:hypothetical protein